MKFLYNFSTLLLITTVLFLYSCKDDSSGDITPPAQITNISFTPLNGGGYFIYTVPTDPDFLYTRAEYIIDTGEKISKTSSVYSDTLFIEGFGQEKEYEIKIFSVDRNSNESTPVVQKLLPWLLQQPLC
jgi:hypothetical protein